MFGGGGGVIVGLEIKELHDYGVTRIFSPEDGQKLATAQITNDPARLAAEIKRAGQRP